LRDDSDLEKCRGRKTDNPPLSFPGKIPDTMYAAAIVPLVWTTQSMATRAHVKAPINPSPIETTGLNKPPLMRKKVQAVTTKENAAPNEAYNSSCGDTKLILVSMFPFLVSFEVMKATWTAAKAMKMKNVVPMNSPVGRKTYR